MKFEVVAGVEGPSLYINDYRMAGPKPWGGGKVIHSWDENLSERDIKELMKSINLESKK